MLTFITNTIAGHGKALRVAERVELELQKRGIPYHMEYTACAGHATALAQRYAEAGLDRIYCIGGDGTAFEVANGLVGTPTALGILPGGTGNDFSRSLGLPRDPIAALDALMNAVPRNVNICHINDRIFLNVCGVGFDVDVVIACDRAKRFARGMLPFLYGVLHTLLTFTPKTLRIELDGEVREQSVLMMVAANGQYFGGGMHVAPMAKLDDDLLDVVIVKPVPRWRIPLLMPRFINGTFYNLKDLVEHHLCRTVRVSAPGMRMEMDGEVTFIEDAQITIEGPKLQLLLPSEPASA